jgi:hypothetical protein
MLGFWDLKVLGCRVYDCRVSWFLEFGCRIYNCRVSWFLEFGCRVSDVFFWLSDCPWVIRKVSNSDP